MKKFILKSFSIILIAFLLPILPARSDSSKNIGKLAMITILSATAIVVKMMVNGDRKAMDNLHEKYGKPDKVIRFKSGFDTWQIEIYGDKTFVFRNGIMQQ